MPHRKGCGSCVLPYPLYVANPLVSLDFDEMMNYPFRGQRSIFRQDLLLYWRVTFTVVTVGLALISRHDTLASGFRRRQHCISARGAEGS
jgi:hypothetical protein